MKDTIHLWMPLIALGLIAMVLLTACTQVGISPTPQPAQRTPSRLPTGTPTTVSQSTATTVPTLQADIELVELTTPGVQPNWPGPAWQVAHEGDFNGDGLNEKVYVLPSTIVPDQATFDRPGYDAYSRVAQEAMIIQAQDGSLRILATLSLTEVRSEDLVLAPLGGVSGRPAAFFIATPLDEATPLAAIPLDGDGMGYTQGFGLRWNPDTSQYRLVSGPDATPPQP
ncbi:hypothetical protein [Candidatus Chloroploca asiatica]|nr:hypothetical protein [Candidatus Chloroploca asiatica]